MFNFYGESRTKTILLLFSFQGNSQEGCSRGNSGLSMTQVFEKNPFLGTELSEFVELDKSNKILCFFSVNLYNEKQSGSYNYRESSNGVNITFLGHLKFGALRFENLEVKLWVKEPQCSNLKQYPRVAAELTGNYGRKLGKKIGIFEILPGSVIKLDIGQDSKATSGGSFSSVVNVLGFRSVVDVNIFSDGLEFHAKGKMYGLFHMSALFKSDLMSWNEQQYVVTGSFDSNVAEKNLYRVLEKELITYSKEVVSRIQERLQLSTDAEKRAKSRLKDVQKLREKWQKKVKEMKEEYKEVEQRLELANKDLEKNFDIVKMNSDEIRLLREELNELCNIRECHKICQKGRSCSTCWKDVIGKKLDKCQATCHLTQQKRLRPFIMDATCINENCKRIHRKRSFLGDIAGILTSVAAISFGVPAAVSFIPGYFVRNAIQVKGRWKCQVSDEKCTKERFQYQYKHNPYHCDMPCEKQHVKKSLPVQCCSVVDCLSFVPNNSCIAENTLCSKARKDALEKISKVKVNAVSILRSLDNAEQNVSLWKMTKERLSIKIRSASTSLTMYQNAVNSLEKANKVTVENRKRKLKILARPLVLRNLLNEVGESFAKIENIQFKTKVSAEHDTKLLSINVTVRLNGTRINEVSTILDFSNLKRSLRAVAKEILRVYIGGVSGVSRKKRSTASATASNDDLQFYTLKTFHQLCSEFSNHRQMLYDSAKSIYSLSLEIQQRLKESDTKGENPFVNINSIFEKVNINRTKAMELGIDVNYDSYLNVLANNPVLREANSLQNEVNKNDFVKSSSALFYKNWLATMESIFETVSDECSGFDDCLKYTIDSLSEINIDTDLPNAKKLRKQIEQVAKTFFNLTRKSDMSINDAVYISKNILQMLKDMNDTADVCAQAPNITEHPAPFTELAVNETLVLKCNATGNALVYQWRFNAETLKHQSSNTLRIKKINEQHSGNYSCEVSNHVASAISISAWVVVGTSPSIVHHPPSRRNVILSEYDSIHCQVEKDQRNVTYQWLFKAFESSSYTVLANERFSYLNFAPVTPDHRGWYFCKVSNKFGYTISKGCFVEVLKYSLPVPAAKVSLTVISRSSASDTSKFYQEKLTNMLASRISTTNDTTQPSKDRIKELIPASCTFLAPDDDGLDHSEICDWTFTVIGENLTSPETINYRSEKQNKIKISATLKLKHLIGQLWNETNADGIAFSSKKTNYSVQSMHIMGIYLECPIRQILVTDVYNCGKLISVIFQDKCFNYFQQHLCCSKIA